MSHNALNPDQFPEPTLPEGYTSKIVRERSSNYIAVHHEGKPVGVMSWKGHREVWGGRATPDGGIESMLIKRPPKVMDLRVEKPHQGKGIATAMWHQVRQVEPELQHDDIQTDDGAAWMKSLKKRGL